MELSQEDIELIDRFKNGELSGDELASFKERMKDAEFASAVSLHIKTIEVISNEGRLELRNLFTSIQSKLEATSGFEKYNPDKSRNGGSMWGWMIGSIFIVAIASYLFWSGKIKPEAIKNLLQEKEVDTVYHYIHHTDTIITNQSDSVSRGTHQKSIRKVISIDTVYQLPKSSQKKNDF